MSPTPILAILTRSWPLTNTRLPHIGGQHGLAMTTDLVWLSVEVRANAKTDLHSPIHRCGTVCGQFDIPREERD